MVSRRAMRLFTIRVWYGHRWFNGRHDLLRDNRWDDKVKLATTAANAKAGTPIDLTSAGTGTQSLTVEAAAPVSGGGNLGIGASVALNIANTTARAELSDTAVITGTVNDITLSADSINKATTTSTAGGNAAGGSGVGIGGAISIAVLNTDTKAYIGAAAPLPWAGTCPPRPPIKAPLSPRRTGQHPAAARRWASLLA